MEALPVLTEALEHTNLCREAVRALGETGPPAGPAVPSLVRLYQGSKGDQDVVLRCVIIDALSNIGPAAREAAPLLSDLAKREQRANTALYEIDPENRAAAIQIALRTLDRGRRQFWAEEQARAIELLGRAGPAAQAAVPALLQELETHSPSEISYNRITYNTAWALWKIAPEKKEKVVAVLTELRTRPKLYNDSDLEYCAVGALWQILPESHQELYPVVIKMLGEWQEAPAARRVTREMSSLRPALRQVVNDENYPQLRPWALLALRKTKEEQVQAR